MPRGLSARVDTSRFDAAFSDYYRFAEQRAENAALIATDRGRRMALDLLRGEMVAAGLGRLGQGISSTSDLVETGKVHRRGAPGFSASGTVFIRSRSERTRGTIEAYTQGADIRPVRGRWLWIPSDDIQRLVGRGSKRQRLTPGTWVSSGMEARVGPLTFIKSVNGYPLLAAKNVGVSLAGASGSARSLTKRGKARKGQVAREFLVAFIGIPRTARASRVDPAAIFRLVSDDLPNLFFEALGRI